MSRKTEVMFRQLDGSLLPIAQANKAQQDFCDRVVINRATGEIVKTITVEDMVNMEIGMLLDKHDSRETVTVHKILGYQKRKMLFSSL